MTSLRAPTVVHQNNYEYVDRQIEIQKRNITVSKKIHIDNLDNFKREQSFKLIII